MKTELTFQDRTCVLHRYPIREHETLQAWSAGDEYLIQHVSDLNLPENQHLLILNDHFGALSCWFSTTHRVTTMSDSHISHLAIQSNLKHNQCPEITRLTTMDEIPEEIDLVLFQLPKSNRHLIWQLTQLRRSLADGCPVIGVNKARDIHTSTLNLFEKYLGTTTTSLAWKKHRLVFSTPNVAPTQTHQSQMSWVWKVDDEHITLHNLPNVFSGEQLDPGARFFLPHIPQNQGFQHIVDLGCGNGVLSIKAARLNPQAHVTCIDESYMAVASAQKNMSAYFEQSRYTCLVSNCLESFDANTCDLILCNPPFHQQQTLTDHIAWQMFCDAKQVLVKNGQIFVIGNRHLGYDEKLTKLFGKAHVKTVAVNHKFVILQATKA